MKSKNLALFFTFVFCLFFVMFCQPAEEEKPITKTEEARAYSIAKLMDVSKDAEELFTEKAKESLIEELIKFKVILERDFLPNTDDDPKSTIGDLLEKKHAILEDITTQYGRVKKKDDFNRIFGDGKEQKADELGVAKNKIKLTIDFLHIRIDRIYEYREIEGNTSDEKCVNLIARAIFKYSINGTGKPPSENQAGGGSGEFLHRRICTWR